MPLLNEEAKKKIHPAPPPQMVDLNVKGSGGNIEADMIEPHGILVGSKVFTGKVFLSEEMAKAKAHEHGKKLHFANGPPETENLTEVQQMRREIEQLRAVIHPSPPDYMVGPPREEKREPDPFGNLHPALMGLGRRV